MKTFLSSVLAIAFLFSVPGMAQAKDKADKPVTGKVTAVDTTKNTITISKGKTESTTFDATGAKVTVDGAPSTLASVTIGMHAKVTVGTTAGTATAIDAKTHKKDGKKSKSTPAPAST